jgi:hypothetical protein
MFPSLRVGVLLQSRRPARPSATSTGPPSVALMAVPMATSASSSLWLACAYTFCTHVTSFKHLSNLLSKLYRTTANVSRFERCCCDVVGRARLSLLPTLESAQPVCVYYLHND